MPEVASKFLIGQIIWHTRFDYRGVIIDVDPVYTGTALWYEHVALSRPPKDRPWYHVLVDNDESSTYVAEQHLSLDASAAAIQHPAIAHYFSGMKGGRYLPRQPAH